MFTGIITDIGTVKKIDKNRGDARFVIETAFDVDSVDIGASIACSGCCLTVVEKGKESDKGWFAVDVSTESLSKTNLGSWEEETPVNLERSLKMGDELGGHMVTGHVDGVAKLMQVTQEGDSYRLSFIIPKEFAGFVAPKGSIALNGISLTVNEVHDTETGVQFGVNIIPHTWDHTNLSAVSIGASVNFEVDIMARYIARMAQAHHV